MPQDYRKPIPSPSPETQVYWEKCKKHELWIQFCRSCEKFYFYPRDFCQHCFSWDVEWRPVSGRGKLYTYAIHYRAFHPGWAGEVPYVSCIVELDEGPRLYSNLVGIDPDPAKIKCDMPVQVVFEDISDEISLPKFQPLSG